MKPSSPGNDSFRDALTALLEWVAERDPAAAARALADWDGEVAAERDEPPPSPSPASSARPLRGCPSC